MLAERAKRDNRGTNMSNLIADVVKQGDQFWSNEDWKQDEGDEDSDSSFEEVEAKPDVFDSDFNDTEDSDDEEDGSDDEDGKPAKASNKYKEPVKKKQTYKEPVYKPKPKPKSESDGASKKRKLVDLGGFTEVGSISSRVRHSTKEKTKEADYLRQKNTLVGNFKGRTKLNVKQEFSQQEMLEEALDTEKQNAKWLKIQQMAEDELARVERPQQSQERKMIRRHSMRGTYPTITFMNYDEFPEIFRQIPPTPWAELHPVRGKYRDPVTGKPYNTVEEFWHIRKQWNSESARKSNHSASSNNGSNKPKKRSAVSVVDEI